MRMIHVAFYYKKLDAISSQTHQRLLYLQSLSIT